MLAGRGPFVGETVQSLLYQVVHEEPPPLRRFVPGLPEEVESTIRRAMAKRPTDRFPTVVAFSRAFSAAIEGRSFAATSSPTTPDSGPIAPSNPRESPIRPAPTTFSKTASEMLSLGHLRARLTPRGVATVGVTAAVVVLAGVFAPRLRTRRPSDVAPLSAPRSAQPVTTPPRSSSPVVTPLPAAPPPPIPQQAAPTATHALSSETSAVAETPEKGEAPPRDQAKHKKNRPTKGGGAVVAPAPRPALPAIPPPKTFPSGPRPGKPHLIEEL
jgi:eukaryotic-like serine/threonine-protein kinase